MTIFPNGVFVTFRAFDAEVCVVGIFPLRPPRGSNFIPKWNPGLPAARPHETAERGGPLEPFKKFARTEPEQAQVAASVAALTFFAIFFRLVFGLFF